MAEYSVVQECTDRYEVRERADGGADISIFVPPRYRDLWMVRLSEFVAAGDIARYGSEGGRDA